MAYVICNTFKYIEIELIFHCKNISLKLNNNCYNFHNYF